MPDQGDRIRDPDSDNNLSNDRAVFERGCKNDPPNGSVSQVSVLRKEGRPRLDLAVDNAVPSTNLKEIVGELRTRRCSVPGTSVGDEKSAIERVFEAQEETARRIAQSLHDEASQMLAIVYLELANIARNSPEQTAGRIDRVIRHLDSVSEQIRGLSHELHPMVLERNGLLDALKQLARGVSKRAGLDVQVTGEVSDLAPAIEVAIYRVVQEALTNVMRHASASRVEIGLWLADDRVFCSVKDDGVGFRMSHRESGDDCGLGFVGMFERIDALGGECHILSGGRKGMELKMGIPL